MEISISLMDVINVIRELTDEEIESFKPETQTVIHDAKVLLEGGIGRGLIDRNLTEILENHIILDNILVKRMNMDKGDLLNLENQFKNIMASDVGNKEQLLSAVMPFIEKSINNNESMSLEEKHEAIVSVINTMDPKLQELFEKH